jgi:3',5'-cyclic AMP phosphodiesterase CpdA
MKILSVFISAVLVSSGLSANSEHLLTDPFLQKPTSHSVQVVWFTEFAGEKNFIEYGQDLTQTVPAETHQLSRMREEGRDREVWRHEAELPITAAVPYRVVSVSEAHKEIKSDVFTAAPTPPKGSKLKILLTSDHQLKPMVAANLEKVKEVAPKIDAVFFAGDLVNHPDLASEWFDDSKGSAFFQALQGHASKDLEKTTYHGGAIIQNAPLFSAIGNHEVMGRLNPENSVSLQLNDAFPRAEAMKQYEQLFPNGDAKEKEKWVQDHSFNTVSYEELFSLPKYYAETFGDVRLVALDAARIWRTPDLGAKGKYSEAQEDLNDPTKWGHGEFIFEPIEKGSAQYQWLEKELKSDAFQQAKFKVVMFHNPIHSLGENITPPYAHPVQHITRDAEGVVTKVEYTYPQEQDILIRDIEPLLVKYGVQLVLYGHDHIWNRFQGPSGIHFLETSNVGNTNGAYLDEQRKTAHANHVSKGDPNGLTPVTPTIAPLQDKGGNPLPYISSNEITSFSILDTESGAVDSYYYDTTKPGSPAVHFDQFFLNQ